MKIDTQKLREMATLDYELPKAIVDAVYGAADHIDELTAARLSYARLFPKIEEGENAGEPDVGGIHKNIRELIAERDALNARCVAKEE